MMGNHLQRLRRKRIQGSKAFSRFRKLIYQELDRRVCFNVDYADEASFWGSDTPEARTQLVKQIAFLNHVVALNLSEQISIPSTLVDDVLSELAELNSQLSLVSNAGDFVDPNTATSNDDSQRSTEDKVSIENDTLNSGVVNLSSVDSDFQFLLADFANSTADIDGFVAFLNTILPEYQTILATDLLATLTTNRNPMGGHGDDQLSANGNALIQIPSAQESNNTSNTTQNNSLQSDASISKPAQQPNTHLLASPLVSTQLSAAPSTESRPSGLVLQSSLPRYGQSTLERADSIHGSFGNSVPSSPAANWFVGKTAKDNARDDRRLISRLEPPAARMQRAHMTIARSRSSQPPDNVATTTTENSSQNSSNEKSVERKSNFAETAERAVVNTSEASHHEVDNLQASDATKPISRTDDQYLGELQLMQERVQDSLPTDPTISTSESQPSDFTSVIQHQVPVAVVVAMGALGHRSRKENSENKPIKRKLQSTETRDISYPV